MINGKYLYCVKGEKPILRGSGCSAHFHEYFLTKLDFQNREYIFNVWYWTNEIIDVTLKLN